MYAPLLNFAKLNLTVKFNTSKGIKTSTHARERKSCITLKDLTICLLFLQTKFLVKTQSLKRIL